MIHNKGVRYLGVGMNNNVTNPVNVKELSDAIDRNLSNELKYQQQSASEPLLPDNQNCLFTG